MTKRYLTIPVVVAGLSLGAASVRAAEPTTADLMKQIDALQAKVQKMETTQQSAVTAKSVDETVTRVLQDADKRSQLMQMEGFTAGWNGERFMLGSANGDFTLMPYVLIQARTTTNYDTAGDNNFENGFEMSRVKIGVDGQIFRNFGYYLRWNSGESDGSGLEQAYIKWMYSDQMTFMFGQFIDPVFHEQLVNADSQLAADRSLINQIITGADESYTQGAAVMFAPASNWNVTLAFTDGVNTGNTDFRDFPNGPTDFGVAGRVEYTAMGGKDSYHDFTAMGNKEDSLVIGAGGDWTQAGDTDNFLHTVDAQWKSGQGNLSVYGAYIGQYIRNGGGAGITGVTGLADNDSYNWGFLVQAGYMLDPNWEVFGRYDYTHLDDAIAEGGAGNTEDSFNEITGGVNYYFHGHHAKVTVDLTWLPNGCPAGASNLGFVSSDDDEFVLRGQFQLML